MSSVCSSVYIHQCVYTPVCVCSVVSYSEAFTVCVEEGEGGVTRKRGTKAKRDEEIRYGVSDLRHRINLQVASMCCYD